MIINIEIYEDFNQLEDDIVKEINNRLNNMN